MSDKPESGKVPLKLSVSRQSITEGVIWKQLLTFAIPILLSNFLQQLYSMVDLLIVGRMIDSRALAAVSATGSITALLIGLFLGLSAGASVIVSQFFGGDNTKGVHESVHTAMAISLIMGIFLSFFGYVLTPPLLRLMGTPADIIDQSITYMRIVFVGMWTLTVYNMGSGILRAIGDSRRPLIFLVISSVINIVLDILLIGPFGMGVAGAAWATVIAQFVSGVLVVLTLMRSVDSYRLIPKDLKIHRHVAAAILKIGVPAGTQSVSINLSNVIIQAQINSFGSQAVAGAGAAAKVDGFLYMTINAFGLAVMTFVGQNYGAKRMDRVRRVGRTGLIMAAGTGLVLGMLIFWQSDNLIALFNDNPEVVRYGTLMVSVLAPTYWIISAGEVYSGFLRGVGAAVYPMVSSIVTMGVLRVAFIFVVRLFWDNIMAVYLSYPFSWILQAVSMLLYVRSGRWDKKQAL